MYVSGSLGDAGLALRLANQRDSLSQSTRRDLFARLETPQPRVELGLALVGVASAAIDISDGLLADLGHILERSGDLGATLNLSDIPCSEDVSRFVRENGAWDVPLSSGDDYELCFTATPTKQDEIKLLAKEFNLPITCIGKVTEQTGVYLVDDDGPHKINETGFEHFK